ncbi:MAG: M14 family zinc carboxypeptidase [Flavobacteriaceae bacterium]
MMRYTPPDTITHFVNRTKGRLPFMVIGASVAQRSIYGLEIGSGPIKVLLWSQMHGNESTTTRALLRFLEAFTQEVPFSFLDKLTLYIIPQLSPDGAAAFTRLNANGIDLNRDAEAQTQPESKVLARVFKDFQPDYALNLHGQRTIFAAGEGGKPATLSFLAPAADSERTVPPQRLIAMQLIAALCDDLSGLDGAIGRYDDRYNAHCVGDRFMSKGVPTLLFEAGHYPEDYQRNKTTDWIYKALLSCFEHIAQQDFTHKTIADYEAIPQNHKGYVDLIVTDVSLQIDGINYTNQQVAVQYEERLEGGKLLLVPVFHSYGLNLALRGHRYLTLQNEEKSTFWPFKEGNAVDFLKNITI